MDQKDVLYVKEEGIATLTLNRPDVRNAYVPGIVEGIYQGLEQARGDSEVRVLVITGTGQAFCSGADVKSMGTNEQRPSTLRYKKGNRSRLNWLSLALQKCDKPIIAAINGVAVGGGLDLALGCDIRIASDKARFSEIYVRRGIIPAQGGVFLLPRLIGLDKACQMILTGEMIEAHEAERIGLVTKVVPHEELEHTTRDLAEKLAKSAPLAVQEAKRAIYKSLDTDLASSLEYTDSVQRDLIASDDHKEGAAAFIEKREPVFKGK
ncbi:MAG: enoyl-CoA hydratase-related protein [Dehalococcoidales bacterium]|jgi:2-(1,2-epoxy-1,2-dihydrophenyl)acetyl-CoA isomerase|nr:enoyl-CoA hydratase-related protein [Dehalococcoidales bacterium]